MEPEMEPRKEPDTVESLFKYGIDYQLHLRKGKQYIVCVHQIYTFISTHGVF